jgi:hypothetical protein
MLAPASSVRKYQHCEHYAQRYQTVLSVGIEERTSWQRRLEDTTAAGKDRRARMKEGLTGNKRTGLAVDEGTQTAGLWQWTSQRY